MNTATDGTSIDDDFVVLAVVVAAVVAVVAVVAVSSIIGTTTDVVVFEVAIAFRSLFGRVR